jgi:hypothetical protein
MSDPMGENPSSYDVSNDLENLWNEGLNMIDSMQSNEGPPELSEGGCKEEHGRGVSQSGAPISGSVDQWWKVLPRRSRDQKQATRGANDWPKGNWRVSCFCLCVKHPWFPTGVLHCPGHPSCAGA